MTNANKRYTPKRSVEALRQKWATVNPNEPRLNETGRILAAAARDPRRFREVCKQLAPETESGTRR